MTEIIVTSLLSQLANNPFFILVLILSIVVLFQS